jgi:hypothetical protein
MCPEDVGALRLWSRSAISGAERVYLFEDVASEVDGGRCPIKRHPSGPELEHRALGKWSTGRPAPVACPPAELDLPDIADELPPAPS